MPVMPLVEPMFPLVGVDATIVPFFDCTKVRAVLGSEILLVQNERTWVGKLLVCLRNPYQDDDDDDIYIESEADLKAQHELKQWIFYLQCEGGIKAFKTGMWTYLKNINRK